MARILIEVEYDQDKARQLAFENDEADDTTAYPEAVDMTVRIGEFLQSQEGFDDPYWFAGVTVTSFKLVEE